MKHTFFLNFYCIPENSEITNFVEARIKGELLAEEEINRKIYELYGLSDKEINYVEGV